jgi:curved DNA-binding protein CbpA
MRQEDAMKILNLSGDINPKIIKKAFRESALKYHPDHNPAGEDMMKLVNMAYDVLKDFTGVADTNNDTESANYPEALNHALNALLGLEGLFIEICGAWLWVTGNTYIYKDTLKELGFKYASKKKAWHFRPEDYKSKSRGKLSLEEIRDKYGSLKPKKTKRAILK